MEVLKKLEEQGAVTPGQTRVAIFVIGLKTWPTLHEQSSDFEISDAFYLFSGTFWTKIPRTLLKHCLSKFTPIQNDLDLNNKGLTQIKRQENDRDKL